MIMVRRRIGTTWTTAIMMLVVACAPCFAWLYDGGQAGRSGVVVSDSTSPVWACEPFTVPSDAWVTGIGAAIARVYGSGGMGFHVYLSSTLDDVPANAIGDWTICPTGMVLQYVYANTDTPIKLDAGVRYYLTFAPNSNNFSGVLSWSSVPGSYGLGTGDYGRTWYSLALPLGVRVDGYFVPEPAAGVALIVGLLGLRTLRWRCFVPRGEADQG